ncbi:MAG TPA: YihY/virulence factor BrkB family protein [Terriglobia bacterium]
MSSPAQVPTAQPKNRPVARLSSRLLSAQFLALVGKRISEDNLSGLSAQTSYYFALSLFPALIFLGGIVGMLPFTHLWDAILRWIAYYLPPESRELVFQTVFSLTKGRKQFLSLGLLGTFWGATGGIMTLISALNAVYQVKETRSYLRRLALSALMFLVLIVLLLATFGLFAVGDKIDQWLASAVQSAGFLTALARLTRRLVSVVLIAMSVTILEQALPNIRRPWRWIAPGTAVTVVGWLLATDGFNFYVRHVASYNRTYGVLGAFVILMVWTYITSLIALIGAEINAALHECG